MMTPILPATFRTSPAGSVLERDSCEMAEMTERAPAAQMLPPVILLGGGANALSVTRALARMGVAVHCLNDADALVHSSRYARSISLDSSGQRQARTWKTFLLGSRAQEFRGAVLLSCCDAGIELIAQNREALAKRFLLDDSAPQAQMAMLDKLSTYRAAEAAGVPTPRFWVVESRAQVESLRHDLVFPLIIKPRLSHVFEGTLGGKKFIVARNYAQVASAMDLVAANGGGCVLLEQIPGGDDLLCSYYTYLDEQSRPLFHFTKRIIRRYPTGMGAACYHVTDWIPQLVEPANKLFHHVGLRGLANVEFKLDSRDGQYKLIECNARFTGGDPLVCRSGFNLAAFVYNRLTGRLQEKPANYTRGLRLWDPVRDFQSFLELRRDGKLSFARWLGSVMHYQTFPYFELLDPMPALARLAMPLRRLLKRKDRDGDSKARFRVSAC